MATTMHQAGEKLGVLGGMGPLATVDFMQKVIGLTPGRTDQDHIPLIVHSVPQIPDRSSAFLAGSDTPWAYLLSGLYTLQGAGARVIAIPCNTAHVWHGRLAEKAQAEILHIGTVTSERIGAMLGAGARIGLLATDATLHARIYHDRLEAAGFTVLQPDMAAQRDHVMAGIHAVKAGDIGKGRDCLTRAAATLIADGADAVVMACTEIPIALEGVSFAVPTVDPTAALAQRCVDRWQSRFPHD